MTNNYQNNINKKLLKAFAPAFDSSTVLLNTVSKQLVEDFDPSTGRDYGQVSMKRPPQYVPQRTNDGDLSSSSANPIQTGKVQAEVSNYATVYVENNQVEEALETDQLDELMRPIAEDIVVELETELALYMTKNASLISGDPDESISSWSDIANAGALLKEIGAPMSMRKHGVINNFDQTVLADLQTQLGVNPEVSSAWNDAIIKKNFGGLTNVMTSNNLPEYLSGTSSSSSITVAATPVSTYVSYANTYRMSIALNGLTAGQTLAVGQVLEFPDTLLVNMRNRKELRKDGSGIPFTATVLEEVTADGSGDVTVSVSGAAIYETGINGAFNTVNGGITAGDDVNVLEGSQSEIYRPALAYCEGFVGMGSVVLPKLHSLEDAILNHNGVSIRVHKFADGVQNKNRYRFDVLPTFATFNPAWGVKMHGTSTS